MRFLDVSSLCRLVATPFVEQVQTRYSLLYRGVLQVKGGQEILLTLRLGTRAEEQSRSQRGLHVGSACLVRSQERVVPLSEVSRLWKQRLKVASDDLRDFRGEGLCERVDFFAETKKLDVECWIRSVDGVSSQEALQRQQIFLCSIVSNGILETLGERKANVLLLR